MMEANAMQYQGYVAKVEYDDEDGLFVGRVMNLRDMISFEGASVSELRQSFHAAVDDYLQWCAERGEEPEKPYSGRFVVRLDPELHKSVSLAAARTGRSLNRYVCDVLVASLEDGGANPLESGSDALASEREP